ncbi:hypothetical protein [Fimbriiglobus ruber]|uniref:Uncharacterized protein n=1 Tax=Fimbriiglobus ruber TaxID=1908690 RepID=A0A225DAE4_9BACT|nr:hypothetical protein [Fimbriiglobus ruber]OWK36634.1 hypothetical protein FRUB_09197 [Fimbriiglobus ruber]
MGGPGLTTAPRRRAASNLPRTGGDAAWVRLLVWAIFGVVTLVIVGHGCHGDTDHEPALPITGQTRTMPSSP